jgi:heavy metal efflux system protein
MIERLVRAAVGRPATTLAIVIALALLAAYPATQLPLDALPDLTNNQVVVLTGVPGRSPEEVELVVTRPVEVALSGLAGLQELRSASRYGISSVTAIFDDAVDAYRARQMVAERLANLNFPEGIGAPELAPLTGGLGEIFHVTLSSPRHSGADLLELAQVRLAPLLKSVPGVVDVNSWGGSRRTLDVVASPSALVARGLTLRTLGASLLEVTGVSPAGALLRGEGQVLVRGEARPRDFDELAAAVVAPPAVRVSDVARVMEGERLRLGAATQNGRGETVYLMAQMLRDQNALEVLDRIHARLPLLEAQLPPDVQLEVVYDRSVLVTATLRTVAKNLLEGGALVITVLLAFLGSLRAGLIAASVIPLSMLFATCAMSLLGLPGNLMSLGALDFGLLVDGAIVLVEGVFHGASRAQPLDEFRGHLRAVAAHAARPVFFSVLVILLVYVPVLSLTGTDGKLFRPMALTVVFALAAALLLSLTWVPALLALFIRPEHVPARAPWLVRVLEAAHGRLLSKVITRPLWLTAVSLGLLAGGVTLASRLGVEFTPQLDEGDLVVQTTRRPDISLVGAIDAGLRLERALLKLPEVERAVTRIGSPAIATDLMGLEQADVFVALKPHQEWRRSRSQLIAEMKRVIERASPGGDPSFTQPIQMRFNELLGGAVTDVVVSVYGEDLGELRSYADRLAALLHGVQGAAEVRVLAPPQVPMLTVRPSPLRAAQFGLRARDVLDVVQAVQVGLDVGLTYRGPVPVPLRMRLAASPEASVLAELAVPLPGGGAVPLARVAELVESDTAGSVQRHDGQRRILVGFNVRDRDLGAIVADAQQRIDRELRPPRAIRLEWGGQYESLRAASARLSLIVPVVLVVIVLVLAATFGAFAPAWLVFALVPFACVGGVAALFARGLPISLPAAIGFIALSGIAVMNGVVWMTRALELSREGVADAAWRAARERARPVLMTALVAALGFVPMMLSTGVGAEVQRPLATVVVGGLFSSTVLTLFVLPTLYAWRRRTRQEAG